VITNPWVILGITLAWISSITGSYFYGHSNGVDNERTKWQKQNIEDTARYNELLISTQGKYRDLENKRAVDAAKLELEAKLQIKEVTNAKDKIINDLRTGSIKLRDQYSTAKACSSGMSGTITSDDSERGSELSDQLSQFLIGEASRADQIVIKLNQCVEQLNSDRK
jgi:hypothetical protein